MRSLKRILNFFSSADKELVSQLEHVLGFTPKNVNFYKLALLHRSQPEDVTENNERLEFLGDAILGAIIADYLFKKYPYQPEGYLTELRSKIVRRETMNNMALRMGLNKLVQYNANDRGLKNSHIFGNALEALIGAVFLDQGFIKTRKFVVQQMVKPLIDLDTMESTDTNYKNQLLNWAQKNNKALIFDTVDEKVERTRKLFTVGVFLDGDVLATGTGYNKKDAGQVAAQAALKLIGDLPMKGREMPPMRTLEIQPEVVSESPVDEHADASESAVGEEITAEPTEHTVEGEAPVEPTENNGEE